MYYVLIALLLLLALFTLIISSGQKKLQVWNETNSAKLLASRIYQIDDKRLVVIEPFKWVLFNQNGKLYHNVRVSGCPGNQTPMTVLSNDAAKLDLICINSTLENLIAAFDNSTRRELIQLNPTDPFTIYTVANQLIDLGYIENLADK